MKRLIPFWLFLLVLESAPFARAQEKSPNKLFRFFEDNDFLNIRGNGTDKAYTNGLRLDLFYQSTKPSRRLVDHLFPKAGKNSIDVYRWSIMQVMVTPSNLTIPVYQSNDYPYSGALFVTRSLSSYNKTKKYNFQTELVSGIRGPASFARQTQVWIHRLINDEQPMGWQNQFNTKILFNVNFTIEKQLAGFKNMLEVIGGAQVAAGTMNNFLTIYPLIRFGRMNPYFNGLLGQFSSVLNDQKQKKYRFI